jgi:hypothetical protein
MFTFTAMPAVPVVRGQPRRVTARFAGQKRKGVDVYPRPPAVKCLVVEED